MDMEKEEMLRESGCEIGRKLIFDAATQGSPEQCGNQMYALECAGLYLLTSIGANQIAHGAVTFDQFLKNTTENIRMSIEQMLKDINEGKTHYISAEQNEGPAQ